MVDFYIALFYLRTSILSVFYGILSVVGQTIFPSNESILTFSLHMVQSVNTRKPSCWYSFIFAKYQFYAACLFCTPRLSATL